MTPQITETFKEINGVIFDNGNSVIGDILSGWPNILGAIGIIVFGFLLGSVFEKIIMFVFGKIKIDFLYKKIQFHEFLEKAEIKSSPLEISLKFIKGYIFLMFFLAATKLVGLNSISNFLDSLVLFLPKLAVAFFIILLGNSFANTLSALVRNTLKVVDAKGSEILSEILKYIIIFISVLAGLSQIDLAPDLINIIFIGFVGALSLSLGLAFGIGGAKYISHKIEELDKTIEKGKK